MKLSEFNKSRKLKAEHVYELGLAEYEKDGQTWVEIPYFKQGQRVNTKHRCLGEKKFFQDKDGEKIFYNIDCLYNEKMSEDTLYITEGEIDAITLIQEGYVKTISVPEGAPNEETGGEGKKYEYLDGMIDTLRKQPEIILAVDSDKNGINLLNDLANRIGKGKCKWIKYPKGCKDINEAYVKYGLKGIEKSLATAQPMKMDGVHKLSQFPPMKEAKVLETGHITGDLFKYRKGDFSVWTGMPAAGKTTLVNDMLCSTAVKNDAKVCFISLEQHPKQDHERALTSWYLNKFPDFNYQDVKTYAIRM
jgi:twinkle protein